MGMGPFFGMAAVLCFMGLLSILLEIQSPSVVMFTGIRVQGVTERGVTSYMWDGERHVINNRLEDFRAPSHPTTVWLSRSDPSDETKAYIENAWSRWADVAETSGWFVAALGFVVAGMFRVRRNRRLRAEYLGRFGGGIPDELVRRLLAERRRVVR